ncbi:hypothetical protein KSC_102340 [Ktedonobacter sp. SOSP1-52]|uniref:DUF998 domain-containing protein n=1 Tax=Ktedonobacter sp. SOSP1-52 TaxID=2778366 RepID=UPI001916683C|nr:DUF998 domain-containing protein [Ktedonobacter sp. SOSP1-52]GHO71342.1 hypothetical protein KSC_102340 [Ktedonobacter sp. SOSP1-52]
MQKTILQNAKLANSATQLTKMLLVCGVVAGPLFTVVGLIQAFTRPGFDITRHALSLLENGDLGWIEITAFLLSGLLFIAGAIGMRQVMRGSRGGTWGPILIGAVGAGLIGAGCFTADPGLGFPPGTPVSGMSWHGLLHLIISSLSFLALVAGCFVFARRFLAQRQPGWVTYTLVSGVIAFVAFAVLASGQLWMTSTFVFAMLNAYVWCSVMAAKLLTEQPHVSA